ncbi:hypothetical protein [Streptomyces sp. rh34]|nr:hypothetical protein [Streptomyces sp. rh34]
MIGELSGVDADTSRRGTKLHWSAPKLIAAANRRCRRPTFASCA